MGASKPLQLKERKNGHDTRVSKRQRVDQRVDQVKVVKAAKVGKVAAVMGKTVQTMVTETEKQLVGRHRLMELLQFLFPPHRASFITATGSATYGANRSPLYDPKLSPKSYDDRKVAERSLLVALTKVIHGSSNVKSIFLLDHSDLPGSRHFADAFGPSLTSIHVTNPDALAFANTPAITDLDRHHGLQLFSCLAVQFIDRLAAYLDIRRTIDKSSSSSSSRSVSQEAPPWYQLFWYDACGVPKSNDYHAIGSALRAPGLLDPTGCILAVTGSYRNGASPGHTVETVHSALLGVLRPAAQAARWHVVPLHRPRCKNSTTTLLFFVYRHANFVFRAGLVDRLNQIIDDSPRGSSPSSSSSMHESDDDGDQLAVMVTDEDDFDSNANSFSDDHDIDEHPMRDSLLDDMDSADSSDDDEEDEDDEEDDDKVAAVPTLFTLVENSKIAKYHNSVDCPAVKAHRKPCTAPLFEYRRPVGRPPAHQRPNRACAFCFPH